MNPASEALLLPFLSGEVPVPQSALFLGAQPHPALSAWQNLVGWQPFRPPADAWERAGHVRVDSPEGRWPAVLLLPGKSKEETLAHFAWAHDLLEEGGMLVVAMPNTAGAGRFEKELKSAAGEIVSLQKYKCRVFRAVRHSGWDQEILSAWRTCGERQEVPGTGMVAGAGIFSPGHPDPGSVLLAEHLPDNLRGLAADLGSGWGYLSRVLADRHQDIKGLHLFEADARALECSRVNLAGAVMETVFHWHDVAAGLPGRYEVIVTNPPFHSGQATDIALGRSFLRSAAAALRTGGRLFLVANRQLPYEQELDALGLTWRKAAENATYKLLFATRR